MTPTTSTPLPAPVPDRWFTARQEAENAARRSGPDPHGLASLLPWPAVSRATAPRPAS